MERFDSRIKTRDTFIYREWKTEKRNKINGSGNFFPITSATYVLKSRQQPKKTHRVDFINIQLGPITPGAITINFKCRFRH